MLANINECFLFLNRELNKNQSGSISGDEFSQFINVAQQQYFRKKLGLTELYTVEKREAPEEVQVTQAVDDSMFPFVVSAPITKTGVGFTRPANIAALIPSGWTYVFQNPDGSTGSSQQPIDWVSAGEYWNRINNYITYPQPEYPIGTYLNNQILIAPDIITRVDIWFYRYPVTPVFAFTVDANDEIVYDPANSVQLEFPNLDWENIVWIAIDYASNFLREEFMKQASESRVRTGQ